MDISFLRWNYIVYIILYWFIVIDWNGYVEDGRCFGKFGCFDEWGESFGFEVWIWLG